LGVFDTLANGWRRYIVQVVQLSLVTFQRFIHIPEPLLAFAIDPVHLAQKRHARFQFDAIRFQCGAEIGVPCGGSQLSRFYKPFFCEIEVQQRITAVAERRCQSQCFNRPLHGVECIAGKRRIGSIDGAASQQDKRQGRHNPVVTQRLTERSQGAVLNDTTRCPAFVDQTRYFAVGKSSEEPQDNHMALIRRQFRNCAGNRRRLLPGNHAIERVLLTAVECRVIGERHRMCRRLTAVIVDHQVMCDLIEPA
jgi:hypothetical protein